MIMLCQKFFTLVVKILNNLEPHILIDNLIAMLKTIKI